MDKIFETAFFTRKTLLKIMEGRNYKDLVKIPAGFNNSIFWNIAHLLVSQQLLCYRLSGMHVMIDEDMISRYGKGALATAEVAEEDIEYIKNNLLETTKKLKEDYTKGIFENFKPYMTSTGIELQNIDDAIKFSSFHDGIHLGIVLSLMKLT
jgi:hypothetical protein